MDRKNTKKYSSANIDPAKIAYHTAESDVKIYMETGNGVPNGGHGGTHTYNPVSSI